MLRERCPGLCCLGEAMRLLHRAVPVEECPQQAPCPSLFNEGNTVPEHMSGSSQLLEVERGATGPNMLITVTTGM